MEGPHPAAPGRAARPCKPALSATARAVLTALAVRGLSLGLVLLAAGCLQDYDTSAELSPCGAGHRVPRAAAPFHRLVVWDSVFFADISCNGYSYEQQYAFFPLLPGPASTSRMHRTAHCAPPPAPTPARPLPALPAPQPSCAPCPPPPPPSWACSCPPLPRRRPRACCCSWAWPSRAARARPPPPRCSLRCRPAACSTRRCTRSRCSRC